MRKRDKNAVSFFGEKKEVFVCVEIVFAFAGREEEVGGGLTYGFKRGENLLEKERDHFSSLQKKGACELSSSPLPRS